MRQRAVKRETGLRYASVMARRVPRAKSFSFDLRADWRPYASPPAEDSEWIYHGTVTLEGVTGALAWRHGWLGIAVAAEPVRELGLWERIRINEDVRTHDALGWETAPVFPEGHPDTVDPVIAASRAPRSSR